MYQTDKSIRILTDTGCGIAAVSEEFVKENNLRTENVDTTYEIEGVTDETLFSSTFTEFKIRLRKKGAQILRIRAIVLPPGNKWRVPIPEDRPPWLSDVVPYLAEPEIITEKILEYHVFLGGDYISLLKFQAIHFDHTFSLIQTLGGWVPRGKFTQECTSHPPRFTQIRINSLQCKKKKELTKLEKETEEINEVRIERGTGVTDAELNRLILIQRLLDQIHIFGPEEGEKRKIEDEFREYLKNFLTRARDGRVIAKLPKKLDFRKMVSKNLFTGKQRIKSVERLLELDNHVSRAYADMFNTWVKDGVLVETTLDELDQHGEWTELPHFGVVRADNATTPVRMVITGDAKDKGKYSTNDFLLPGPNVLPQIPNVLTHIRMKNQFILADISKAFVQVQLHDEDKYLLAFRWPVKNENGS
jgi:hypothetical protein